MGYCYAGGICSIAHAPSPITNWLMVFRMFLFWYWVLLLRLSFGYCYVSGIWRMQYLKRSSSAKHVTDFSSSDIQYFESISWKRHRVSLLLLLCQWHMQYRQSSSPIPDWLMASLVPQKKSCFPLSSAFGLQQPWLMQRWFFFPRNLRNKILVQSWNSKIYLNSAFNFRKQTSHIPLCSIHKFWHKLNM